MKVKSLFFVFLLPSSLLKLFSINLTNKGKKKKIIVCSEMGKQKMVIQAIDAGAKDFIVKPFKDERVINALANL